MELTEELKELYIETAEKLKGSNQRIFMAQVVGTLESFRNKKTR